MMQKCGKGDSPLFHIFSDKALLAHRLQGFYI